MEQSHKRTDIFLTHTWRKDTKGRDNHARVSTVNVELSRRGFTTWFDSQKMEGRIQEKMAEGIDYTHVVLVFVTQEYMTKIDSKDKNDNCYFEFERAMAQKTEKNIICVVMEDELLNQKSWSSYLYECLGSSLYVSMTGDFNDAVYLNKQLDELTAQLELKGVEPSQMKECCPECKVVDGNNQHHPLYVDGTYCVYCTSVLQETNEPKHYCMKCNIHESASYCFNCKENLVDERKKIRNAQEHLRNVVSLKESGDTEKYSSLDALCKEKNDKVKEEMEAINRQREEVRNRGEKLALEDAELNQIFSRLKQNMDSLLEGGLKLPSASNTIESCLRKYDEKIKKLDVDVLEIVEERSKIVELRKTLARTEEEFEENLSSFDCTIADLKDKSVQILTEDAIYAKKLKREIIAKGFKYVSELIKKNDVESLKKAITTETMLLEVKDKKQLNAALYAAKHGSLEMLSMLVQAGFDVRSVDENTSTTALHLAFYNSQRPEIAIWLLRNFPELLQSFHEVLKKDILTKGFKYIAELLEKNTVELLKEAIALEKNILEMKDENFMNPLLYTARFGTLEMLNVLVAGGADARASNEDTGETALHFAFCNHKQPDIAIWLLTNFSELSDVKDHREKTPVPSDLYIKGLIDADDVNTFEALASYREYIFSDAIDPPFLYAARSGTIRMLELLVRWNCFFKIETRVGETALHIASEREDGKIAEITEWLCINCPILIYSRTKLKGTTPLSRAVCKNSMSAVEILLKYGSPVLVNYGESALEQARQRDNKTIVDLLEAHLEKSRVVVKLFHPSLENIEKKRMRIRFFPVRDLYSTTLEDNAFHERDNPPSECHTIVGWENGVEVRDNIRRHVEDDWYFVYLCRENGDKDSIGKVQWGIDVADSGLVISVVSVYVDGKCFDQGILKYKLFNDDKTIELQNGRNFPTDAFAGSKMLRLGVSFFGEHFLNSQLFRIQLSERDHVSLDIDVTFQ